MDDKEVRRARVEALSRFSIGAQSERSRAGEDLVEAAGVEPASENVTGQENYMLSRVHAPGITLGRSRRALRTDKKRDPLA